MKAVVMAGGEGSRLRPLTLDRPKPLLPVVNRPMLSHILYLLKQHGITDVVLTLQYMAANIQDFFGDGRSLGMNIEYVIEESPLGTAGSVKHAQASLDRHEPFLVISGDALTDFDLSGLIAFHRERNAMLTMALHHVPDPLEYGVINADDSGRVAQFQEKPSWREVTSDTVNTGIYVVDPDVLLRIPPNQRWDWSHDMFPAMVHRGEPLYGHVATGYWCDIGSLAEYRRANADLLNGLVYLGSLGLQIGAGLWAAGPVEIASDAQIIGPVYLGEEVQIKSGAVIHGPTVIRDYTIVDKRARISHAVIWRNSYIGQRAEVHGSVIGRQCSLKSGATIFEGVVVGDRTVVGEGAVIQGGVKIWPGKEVENGATVTHSIIWGSQGRRSLFGRYGVTGVVNVDLTPDVVARLGAAFGSVLPKGSKVTINRDPHRSPRMIKRALVSGLPSSGAEVIDLRTIPIPVARYYTRAIGAAGGAHVRLSPYDPRVVDIRFFGPDGLNLSRDQERAIERTFFREDFRRAFLEDIGNIEYAPDAADLYARGYLDALDGEVIKKAALKIVVDFAHAPAAEVLPQLLERLNVEVVPLNARVDANKLSLSHETVRASLSQLARISGALRGIHLGVRLDVGGERIYVVDDSGTSVPNPVLAGAMAALVLRSHRGATIAVTIDQSEFFERLAAGYGGRVIRCPVDSQSLMSAVAAGDVVMACDGAGHFVFPALHAAVDGLFALGKLLELLALQNTRLSTIMAGLPQIHIATGQVSGVWETKGKVMRCLLQQVSHLRHETLDGVKFYLNDEEWVLIRPDGDTATFFIVAEASSLAAAQALVADYSEIVRDLVTQPCGPVSGHTDVSKPMQIQL